MTVLFSATSEAEDVDSAMWSQAHWPPLKIKQLQSEKVNDRLSGLACCQSFGQSRGWNETLWGRHHQAAPLGQQWPPPRGGASFRESCLGFPFSFLLPGPFVSEQTSVPLFPCLKRVWDVLHPWWLRAIHIPLDVWGWEKCTCTRNFQLHSQAMVNHVDVNIYNVYNILSMCRLWSKCSHT